MEMTNDELSSVVPFSVHTETFEYEPLPLDCIQFSVPAVKLCSIVTCNSKAFTIKLKILPYMSRSQRGKVQKFAFIYWILNSSTVTQVQCFIRYGQCLLLNRPILQISNCYILAQY